MRASSFFMLLMLWAVAPAQAQRSDDPGRRETDVELSWGLRIPVADGTELGGTLYRPRDHAGERLPAIVTITPYISDRYHPDALYFARNDFAFLVVDSRGRGNSDGIFRPNSLDDGRDGRDVVEWVAHQPWSDGRVLMRGGSYGGYNQWATVRHFPPHLTGIVPIAAAFPGIDFPMNYNVPFPYVLRWLALVGGTTPQGRLFGDDGFWNRKFREYHRSGMAFEGLDDLVGMPSETFQEWISHPQQDDFWAARTPAEADYARLELPILTITGYYDGDQPGAMEYYRRHMRHGSETGKANHYLLLGPWNHGGTRIPVQEFGGLRFGDAMMFDAFRLDRDWYNWVLGRGERPAFLKDRVTYFVAGANEWKGAASLEEVADDEIVFHLRSAGPADSLFRAGDLHASAPVAADTDQYVYDPLDLSKAYQDPPDDYLTDQAEIVSTDGDGLIYQSPPFDAPVEITGYARFEAWFEMDVPDTDIEVTLYEILPDGTSIGLTGETQRARFRGSLAEESLLSPGEVAAFTFERFYFFSRLVGKGSRLRLFIRPANKLSQQRHYNGAEPVHEQTRADARTATVRLHTGPRTPTRLILPVVQRDEG